MNFILLCKHFSAAHFLITVSMLIGKANDVGTHWCRLIKKIGGTKSLWGQRVPIADKSIGDSQLMGGVPARATPKVNAYVGTDRRR